jgi:single-strand DNA-binding protein
MKGLNKVILIGNLGKDPDYKEDLKRASFSMATTESYNDKNGQRVDMTEWHNIVVWGNLAEIANKYLRKGTPIYLEGKIRNRSYDDNEGNKKYITEIRADNFIMLGGRKDEDQSTSIPAQTDQSYPTPDMSNAPQPDDDLPF